MKETQEHFIARMKSFNFKKYQVKFKCKDDPTTYEEIRYALDRKHLKFILEDDYKKVSIVSVKEIEY